jgi:Na+/H+ antiporter NhaD/arsenite permease-like protein
MFVPALISVLPFVALLAAIALAPFLFGAWWSRHYAKVTVALALIPLLYYLASGETRPRVGALCEDYISFICLIGSLFIISGGIHINVKGKATPRANVLFLLIGALASNILGTTGASMLLIRPWLRMNHYRLAAHHVVFFIFVISNVGGCLTPIGDPPLFLGYLKGIPFWWIATNCWPIWLVAITMLLVMFYLVDVRSFRRATGVVPGAETYSEQWRFQGLGNLVFLAMVLGSVFIHRPLFLREGLMLGAAILSYFTTSKRLQAANDFHFGPIKEVAIIFAGIFATMMPALDWLQSHATQFGHPTPAYFFWSTGVLSSVLDNAPTYLSFLSVGTGTFAPPEVTAAIVAQVAAHGGDLSTVSGSYADQIRYALAAANKFHLGDLAGHVIDPETAKVALLLGNPFYAACVKAISVASVFFGAATYLGNAPNLMVKAMADHQKAPCPTFPGYILKFALPFLLPVLILVWLIFFRH